MPVRKKPVGTSPRKRAFPVWPQFNPATGRRIQEILESGKVNYWTGPVGMRFEKAWAAWLGVGNAVSVSNGTAALHVALAALGIGSGDEVICPSYSFIASSFCALHAGAVPVFVDTAGDHLIDPAKIEAAITRRTKAIVVVHLYGMVADMDPIMEIARRHSLAVVEDCAQCIGGVYKGRKTGSIGTVGCFSFCQSKHFTTGGEGGMVCCNDDALAAEFRSLRDHGYDIEAKMRLLASGGPGRYLHRRVGYNFRMTEIQSEIGLGELERLDTWNLPRRRKLGRMLVRELAGHPLVKTPPLDTPERENSYWLAPFVLDVRKAGCAIGEFAAALREEGANACTVQWQEMYREEAYSRHRGFGARNYPFDDPANRKIDYAAVKCPVAARLARSTVSFWTHPVYSPRHMKLDADAFFRTAERFMAKRNTEARRS